MNLSTYNISTMMCVQECVVRRLGEKQKILNDGHVLYWRGEFQGSEQESGVDFVVQKQSLHDVHRAGDIARPHFSIIVGDFNAKIGKNIERETVVGYHGIGISNFDRFC